MDDATGEPVEREVRYDFDRPLQIHDTRPEAEVDTVVGKMTFTLYDEPGARRTARATQCNVTTGDSDAGTVIFSTDGPCGSGSTYSLAGAGDSVVGGVVFGNEPEVEGDGTDKSRFSGVLSNDPANSETDVSDTTTSHDEASRNDQDTFE